MLAIMDVSDPSKATMTGDPQDAVKGRQWTRPRHCPIGGQGWVRQRRGRWEQFLNSPGERQFYQRTKEGSCTFPKRPYLGLLRLEGVPLFSVTSGVSSTVPTSEL